MRENKNQLALKANLTFSGFDVVLTKEQDFDRKPMKSGLQFLYILFYGTIGSSFLL